MLLVRPLGYRTSTYVDWKMYTNNLTQSFFKFLHNTNQERFPVEDQYWLSLKSQKFLNIISKDLQVKMMTGSRLSCHSGQEGLFKKINEKFLHVLSQYTLLHREMSKTQHTRTLVWQCPINKLCGGIADRIRGMAFALLLAIFSRRRLILDWESAIESVYFKPNLIDWKDKYIQNILHSNVSEQFMKKEPHIIKFSAYSAPHDPFIFLSKGTWWDYLNIIGKNTSLIVMVTNAKLIALTTDTARSQLWLYRGLKQAGLLYLSRFEFDNIVGLIFRYLFQLNNGLLKEVSRAKEVLQLHGQPYIGIHIRTGFVGVKQVNDFNNFKQTKDELDWKTALQCAVEVANKFFGSSSPIFLATDSNLVKDMAIRIHGTRFRTLNNYLLHIDQINRTKEPEHLQKEGALYTLVDLILLAQSYVQVRGLSGFAWLASLICGLPLERTISSSTCTPEKLTML